jgi:serine/threonine protein kinase
MAEPHSLGTSGGDPLEELVFLYLEEREQGIVSGIAEFEERHPEAARDEVRSRIRSLEAAGLLATTAAGDPFPERLGEFQLLERLGGGGMGVVFRAQQTSLGREVALKLIRPEQLYFPRAKERFRREVEAVARLAHPGIVPVYACGEERGVPYYAMELVAGRSLGDVLRPLVAREPRTLTGRDLAAEFAGEARGPIFERGWIDACLELARDVALALDHAHSRGVLHRDVKPSNVMLTPDGRARLLDFGLAAHSGSARLTGTGAQLGSTAYMSPELATGRAAEADARADVYSLGATLYELLTLRLPYTGASTTEIVERIQDGRAVAPRRLNPALSADAETVCLTAMAPDPARRYASARAFADDLQRVLDGQPIAARRASGAERVAHWARRHPAQATSVALAALLVVGGPLVFGLQQARAAREQRRLNADLLAANGEVRKREEGLALANKALEERRVAAEQAAQRAQRNFERAQRSVDEMLAGVAGDELANVPQMESVRRALFEKALAFYSELLEEAPDDPGVKREHARTLRSIGDLLSELGRFDEAGDKFNAAIELLRELERDDPSLLTKHALAQTIGQLGNQHSNRGEREASEALWREAIALLEDLGDELKTAPRAGTDLVLLRNSLAFGLFAGGDAQASLEQYLTAIEEARPLHAADPGNAEISYALASSLSAAAQVHGHLLQPVEADRAYAEAFTMLEQCVRVDPSSVRLRAQLVEVANNYGVRLLTSSDTALTERVLRQGVEAARTLASDFPADPEKRKSLAVIALNLAVHYANAGRFAEAAPAMRVSVDALESLRAEHPEIVEYPYFLGAALSNAAGCAVELGDLEGAERDSKRAVELLRGALEATGGHIGVKVNLSSALFQRAGVHAARGDVARALETAEESLALEPRRSDVLYEGVEILGAIAQAARAAADPERAERAVELALATFELAIQSGYNDRNRARNAEKLALVRERPRFAELLAQIPEVGD